ncbi:enoyl-CoA hydratase/isomerase family protein [Ramlibacter lithotrophicus]|uniref:enoyl-CoA hydratase/isomerase family protein n=1 Tax=Ramlibacter lithotrophicus TaxID=2606681 RepID=UPI0014398B3F|nr:enoyl-CoA hydratase-related protein [Ramlibacter lithotrophicus]
MSEQHLTLETRGGIATLALNRPEALNALSPAMTDALIDATQECERNPEIRCVVLRGAGRAFMAGGDVKGLHASLSADAEAHVRRMEMRVIRAHQLISQLRRMPKPVIAAVHGAVAGFGVGLSMAADVVVAREDAFFLVAYRHIGLTADAGVTHFLPRIVGERKALEMSLFGERCPAEEALRLGMVNWVVPTAGFDAFVRDKAAALAAGPSVALGHVKALIRGSLDRSWDEQSHREAEGIAAASRSHDHLEGVTAFVEKRAAVFVGR